MSIWFPSLSALDELTVTEIENGFEFSAPPDSACGAWLGYYNSSKELQEEFSSEIIQILRNKLKENELEKVSLRRPSN